MNVTVNTTKPTPNLTNEGSNSDGRNNHNRVSAISAIRPFQPTFLPKEEAPPEVEERNPTTFYTNACMDEYIGLDPDIINQITCKFRSRSRPRVYRRHTTPYRDLDEYMGLDPDIINQITCKFRSRSGPRVVRKHTPHPIEICNRSSEN
jgi:hypothetical protein